MSRQTDRDHALGTAYWTHMSAYERQVAARWWDEQMLEVITRPHNMAAFADLQLGDVDGAARMWLAGCRATRAELEAYPSAVLRRRGGRLTAWPLLAGDEDLLAGVLHVAPPLPEPDTTVGPYSLLLPALVGGDDDLARRMARHYDTRVTPENWRKQTALPHLGAIALAILEDDARAATTHMTATLEAEASARARGFMRDGTYVSVDTAGLWAAGRRRGVDIDIPDRFHAVPLRFAVSDHIDLDGEDAYRERFTWPTDLLPTHMFNRAAQLRTDDV